MNPKVIVYKKLQQKVKDIIERSCDVYYFENLPSLSDSSFTEVLKNADGLLGSGLRIDEQILDLAPNLKIVCNSSVGYDNFDLEVMTNRNVMATNTPDVLTDTTADTIFGLMLATARRFPELNHLVKSGNWNKKIGEEYFGVDVHHKVLGIIGMGRIGKAIAKRAKHGFDMEILYHNRSRDEEAEQNYDATYCELDDLLRESDFICVMVPLTPQTKYSLREREFNMMKESAVLVVGSRGGIVHEEELYSALKNGTLRAAGLDVFENEPTDKENPLLTCDNVVALPHIGSATLETREKMDHLAVENLLKGLEGKTPPNLLNVETLHLKENM